MDNEFITNKVVVFGGSFNPPTIAHEAIIKAILQYHPQKLIIIPNGDLYNHKKLVTFEHRKAMCELLLDDLAKPLNVVISDIENHDTFKGTYYTLKQLNHPTLIIGSDCLVNLKNWINSIELVKENNFLVFTRELSIDKINNLINNDPLLSKYKDHFYTLPLNFPDVSSSEFRIKKDKMIVKPEVFEYIKNNNLYEVK